jgi:hypothetical protein
MDWRIGMDAKKKARLFVQRTILAALLIGGCITCLALILPMSRL